MFRHFVIRHVEMCWNSFQVNVLKINNSLPSKLQCGCCLFLTNNSFAPVVLVSAYLGWECIWKRKIALYITYKLYRFCNNCSQLLSVCKITNSRSPLTPSIANSRHPPKGACVELLCLENSATMQQNVSELLISELQENWNIFRFIRIIQEVHCVYNLSLLSRLFSVQSYLHITSFVSRENF